MSYTQTHSVALTVTCPPCAMSVGSDNAPAGWVEMFRAAHTHGERPPFFVCLPCSEGHHQGCSHYPCECPCRKERDDA